jgi:hypothetical protein
LGVCPARSLSAFSSVSVPLRSPPRPPAPAPGGRGSRFTVHAPIFQSWPSLIFPHSGAYIVQSLLCRWRSASPLRVLAGLPWLSFLARLIGQLLGVGPVRCAHSVALRAVFLRTSPQRYALRGKAKRIMATPSCKNKNQMAQKLPCG